MGQGRAALYWRVDFISTIAVAKIVSSSSDRTNRTQKCRIQGPADGLRFAGFGGLRIDLDHLVNGDPPRAADGRSWPPGSSPRQHERRIPRPSALHPPPRSSGEQVSMAARCLESSEPEERLSLGDVVAHTYVNLGDAPDGFRDNRDGSKEQGRGFRRRMIVEHYRDKAELGIPTTHAAKTGSQLCGACGCRASR